MLWWLPVNWTSQFVFDHQTVDISLLFTVYLCIRRQTPVSCFSLTSTFQCFQVPTFDPLDHQIMDISLLFNPMVDIIPLFVFVSSYHSHSILDSRQLDISLLSFRSLCVNAHIHLTFFPSGAYHFGWYWISLHLWHCQKYSFLGDVSFARISPEQNINFSS